ncbi:MAG: efflux RND transporter periplasmic adaptor subunit [Bacteroidota bacterium]
MKAKNKKLFKMAGFLVIGILLGWLLFGGTEKKEDTLGENHDHTEATEEIWTCSMHPQIRQNEPGDCPICGMELIPLETTDSGGDPASYQMSENAMKLANVQTMVVGKGDASKEIRLNGKVQVDERNAYSQSTHIPGRIEQLSINFTGEKVSRGQILATIYSPELVTAQEELLQAESIKESQPELFEAAKEKLRNWKIGQAQIDQILAGGKALQRFSIRADVNGIVTEKMVELGDYVERGMPIYEISDLSKVWILFDLYESELVWVKEGSTIEYTINSIPGETFQGKISFIDPLINPQTRVATARVEVDNKNGILKPEMFASGVVKNTLGEGDTQELVIPKSAVLWTGKRSLVYVKNMVDGRSSFQVREITLGPALGDSYIVKDGLEPGEEIVFNGTFTVDAAVQLSGRPSMMNPSSEETTSSLKVDISEESKVVLNKITSHYLDLKDALVKDDFSAAKKEASELRKEIEQIPASKLNPDAAIVWESYKEQLSIHSNKISNSETISGMRDSFDELSESMIGMLTTFKLAQDKLYVLRCPMANNDRGANWLSLSSEIENPYYGSAMLRCGEVIKEMN